MRKLVYILLTMALTTTIFTACSKSDTKNESNSNNANNNVTAGENNTEENNTVTNVTVTMIMDAFKEAYGDSYLPNTEIPAEFLESEFGLTSDMYEEVKAEQPMIGAHADRVVVVKAAEGKVDDVEAALIAAKDKKINDSMQYPMNLPKINATKVVKNGDFVCFLLVGAINDSVDLNEEDAKKFAEDEVAKGVKAFNELFQ